MVSFSLLRFCLLSLTQAAAGHQSLDDLVLFALLGDDITLPCGLPSIKSCSSVSWNVAGQFQSVVKAGRVTAPSLNPPRLGLLRDCSLQIHRLVLDDARLYTCHSGTLSSSVSFQILQVIEHSTPAEGTIELQCFLNIFQGLAPPCNNKGLHIKWSTENNTPLKGDRFRFVNTSDCFSKLIITKNLTDHHRKWKCQLTQNDTVKATTSYTTTLKDGLEEVFAAVGESVSLSCGDASSLGVSGGVKWAVGERTLTDDVSPTEGLTDAFHVDKNSSLVIDKVSARHAGDYQCSGSTGQQAVFNKIRLHTVDVTSEIGPGGDNLTLTCVLTCTKGCRSYFNLTWSGGGENSWQSGLMTDNNTLMKRLFLPVLSSDELTCFAHREGDVMAAKTWKTWHAVNSLQTPAWVALPLALLVCVTAGGLYMHMKRKHNRDAGNEQSSIGMHVYEDIQDARIEEPDQRRQNKSATTTDSFYDLLQAVN